MRFYDAGELVLLTYSQYKERYFELLSERKIKGYLFEEKNYFSKAGEAAKSA